MGVTINHSTPAAKTTTKRLIIKLHRHKLYITDRDSPVPNHYASPTCGFLTTGLKTGLESIFFWAFLNWSMTLMPRFPLCDADEGVPLFLKGFFEFCEERRPPCGVVFPFFDAAASNGLSARRGRKKDCMLYIFCLWGRKLNRA